MNGMQDEQNPQMKVIGHLYNDFHDKFGIPRQSGLLSSMRSVLVFENEYRNPDALRGLEAFSHLWLIWLFSENMNREATGWKATVRPPRLGGNTRMGVFATRSPFRPNPIGLSCVRLEKCAVTREFGTVLVLTGADLVSGTPILDIKPYIAYTDAQNDAVSGFAETAPERRLDVRCPGKLLSDLSPRQASTLLSILAGDPRPSYQSEAERVYKMDIGSKKIAFRVDGETLYVLRIEENHLPRPDKRLLALLDED